MIVPLPAVFSRIPVLLTEGVGEPGIQILGGTAGPAGQRSRTEADDRDEPPDLGALLSGAGAVDLARPQFEETDEDVTSSGAPLPDEPQALDFGAAS